MRKLSIVVALMALTALAPASAAASPHHPTGEFAPFGDCPLSNPSVVFCVYSKSSGGYFQMGEKTVPLKYPVILQGGFRLEGFKQVFVGAEDGETLTKVAQPVPGGLLGIEAPSWWPSWLKNWFNEQINNGFTGVNATVEVAGSASDIEVNTVNLVIEKGTAIKLPIKVHLTNPILGSNCYIGSNSNPLVIEFTSGTTSPPPPNEPISGSAGTLTSNEEETLITLSGGRLVNNSYAAPGANGCGGLLSFFIDPLVDSLVGLPSPAGTNAAVLEGVLQTANAEAVRESE